MGACLHAKQFEMVQQYLTRWADSRNVETVGTAKYQSDLIGNNVSIYLFLFLISELSDPKLNLKLQYAALFYLIPPSYFNLGKLQQLDYFISKTCPITTKIIIKTSAVEL